MVAAVDATIQGLPVVGVVLGAGLGRRLGRGPKAFVEIDGETLLARGARTLFAGGLGQVVAVVPAGVGAVAPPGVVMIPNPDPETGPLGSARLALDAVPDVWWVVLLPVDHPDVDAAVVEALLLAAARTEGDVARVSPRYRGRGGHPALITPRGVAAIRASTTESSLREVLRAAGATSYVEVDDPGVLRNLNRPGD